MAVIKRKIVATKQKEALEEIEEDEEEDEIEEVESDEVEDAEPVREDAEDAEDAEETEDDEDDEAVELPDVTLPISGPNEGFDYFGTVHADLKAAGYVANKGETKALLKYLNQMAFFNAFENGKHSIDGLGVVYSDINPEKVKKATFDMKNGIKKGENYTVAAKHVFGFTVSGPAKNALAEISEIEGWEPQTFLDNAEEADEE